jgi:ATP-dependent Lon protease
MSTSLLSKVFDIAVRRTVSMTGEITTLGKVLPIGGLDRKIPAAIAAGVTDIVVPKANHKSLEQVKAKLTEDVRSKVRFHEVGSIEELVSLRNDFGESVVFQSPILPASAQPDDKVAIFPVTPPGHSAGPEYKHG